MLAIPRVAGKLSTSGKRHNPCNSEHTIVYLKLRSCRTFVCAIRVSSKSSHILPRQRQGIGLVYIARKIYSVQEASTFHVSEMDDPHPVIIGLSG